MPRKTKEQKELEKNEKEVTNKTTKRTSSKKEPATKKATSTTKKASTKASTATKKANTEKKASTTKSTTAKKTTTKKVATTKKASTEKKTSTTKRSTATKKTTTQNKKDTSTSKTASNKKVATAKKTTTKRKTTKKESLIDPSLEVLEYYDLPYRYNKTVVKILAQTPSTLFVYWEISDEDIENYKKQYGENFFEITRPVLIVHNTTLDYSFEIDINDFANSWYLKVNNSKCDYKIELGRRPIEFNYSETIDTDYIYVATSNAIEAPNDHILLENIPTKLKFRNIKNNKEYIKNISDFFINDSINNIYNIYDLYKLIYEDENIDVLANPSSGGNPSSGTFSSTFK